LKANFNLWVMALAIGFGGAAMARTVSVVEMGENTVKLAFGDADGKAYNLCLAYGTTDGGSDKYAWTSFTKDVATIAADQTEYTYTIPSEVIAANAHYRLFLMQTSNLPYTQELTYIESVQNGTQTQYIKTGVKGNPGIRVESDLSISTSADTTMIGSKSSGGVRFFPIHVNTKSKWSMGYNTFHAGSQDVVVGKKVHAIGELKAGKQSLTIDGASSYSNTEGAYSTDLEMYIFACNINGSAQQKSKIRVYNMQIYENDRLVRSFIPVKRTNGWGGMCDQVTGGDYGNAGNGSFTMGAVPADEANRRGIVKDSTPTLKANIAARDVLATMPWQQNVYTNRFTIMCEAKAQTDGLQLQYGAGYAETVAMTGESVTGGTWIYKARVVVNGAEGTEIPYRMALAGQVLAGSGTNSAAGVVKLWKQDENDFTCAIWGDNQQGARQYDWDANKFQYLGCLFRHMLARDVDFGICTGDMASSANYASQIRPCDLEATDEIFGRVKPYYVAWGNHDTSYPNNKPFFETPAIDDPDYLSSTSGNSYLYRGNTLIILLDDGLCKTDATKTWLANLLATPRAKAANFRLVYHHQPIYTEVSGSELSFLRQTFIDGKVDVVFGGHMHGYERFLKDGVVYIINGCAGYLDHNITVRRNYGDDSFVGGHIDLPYLWARQESVSVNNVLGAAEPARMGMVTGYAEMSVKDGQLCYRQHAFNADGSYIGVCDSFRLNSKRDGEGAVATQLGDAPCANPQSFAEFIGKPVTNAKWKEFADAVGIEFAYAEGADNKPVVNVSKTDIARFLAWLNGSTGNYRLPTVEELTAAFGGQLRREVSEWTSSIDPATGWCRILGSPAKARKGVYERTADRPALMTADCHADYVGFRLATGAAPVEPTDPFAAALAALAAIENPAAVYKWENNALVDISSEWNAAAESGLEYQVPVIFTGAGELSFTQPKGVVLAGGAALPKATAFTVTGPLEIGTRLALGRIPGAGKAELTGFVLSGETLTLNGVTSVGSCVQFRSGDGTLRLAGANDFASAQLNFGAASVTNLVAASAGATTTLRARSARQYKEDANYNLTFGTGVAVTFTESFQCEQANYWIDGSVDAASISMTSNNGPFFWGAGTLTTGEFAMFQNSWVRWGVSNLVITSGHPFRTNVAGVNRDRFQIEGDGVRLGTTADWTMPSHDQWNVPIEISTALVKTQTPRLVVDTLDPDGVTPHTVTFAPNLADGTFWGITKEKAGTLVLDGNFQQTAETRVVGGELRLANNAQHVNAAITVAAEATLTLAGTATVANVTFDGGTLALGESVKFMGVLNGARTMSQPANGKLTVAVGTAMDGAVTLAEGTAKLAVHVTGVAEPGEYLVLGESGLKSEQVTITSDATQPTMVVVDESGNVMLRVLPTGEGKIAYWTGKGTAGDLADAANWSCFDNDGQALTGALPDADTTVYLGGAAVTFSLESAPNWKQVVFSGRVQLGGDVNWSGFANATAGSGAKIDLGGHVLTLASPDFGVPTITDSSDNPSAPGELRMVVAAGVTVTNATLQLSGNLKFVKEGAGTLVQTSKNQTYVGGTEVRGGVLTSPVSGGASNTWSANNTRIFGAANSTITVREGAVFDTAGNYDYTVYTFVLDGGTLRNGGCDQSKSDWASIRTVKLTADSVLDLQYNTYFTAPEIDLGGYALDVHLASQKYWFPQAGSITNGAVRVTLDGSAATDGRFQNQGYLQAATVDWDLNCYLEVKNDLTARDFICRHEGTWGWSAGGTVSVHGTFKPVSDYFCNVGLQDGATLDLTQKTNSWSTASLDTARSQQYRVTAVEGATVTVKVAGRSFEDGEYVVSWTDKADGTTWQWDVASAEAGIDCVAGLQGITWGRDSVKAGAAVVAHWTGATDSDLANPDNWSATNVYADAVAVAPSAATTVHFQGNCAATAQPNAELGAAKIVCNDVFLSADCDWRALGAAPLEGRVDLNGHKLRVAGLAGQGTITDRPLAVPGYEPLEWIDSDGSNYLRTEINGSTGISADADVLCLPQGTGVNWQGDACLVGSRKGDMRFIPIWNVNAACGMGYNGFIGGARYGGSAVGSFERGIRYTVSSHMRDGRQTMYMDGVQKCLAANKGTYDTQLAMWIFTCNKDGVSSWPLTARLYALRLYRNEALVGDYVPAKRTADGEVGLYDKVGGKFLERQGTNPFGEGPKVTATPGTAGELWVDVSAGTTNVNSGVSIAGGAKLVKAGPGVYETTVKMQTYTGGNRVAGGGFNLGYTPVEEEMPLGVAAPTVVIDAEGGRPWGEKRAFGWQTKPQAATFTMSQRTRSMGYRMREASDGIHLDWGMFIIIR